MFYSIAHVIHYYNLLCFNIWLSVKGNAIREMYELFLNLKYALIKLNDQLFVGEETNSKIKRLGFWGFSTFFVYPYRLDS